MTFTPLDLPGQSFKTAVRGFDRKEVSAFLAELASEYEQALRDADGLRDEVARVQALLEEHKEQERNLQSTLLSARKLADEIRHTAEEESQRIIADAQARAEDLVQNMGPRLEALDREISVLRKKREHATAALASTVATLRKTLEAVKAQA
jgi:cell division initiation protein